MSQLIPCANNSSGVSNDKSSILLNVDNFYSDDVRNRSESLHEPLCYPLGPKCTQTFVTFREFLMEVSKVLGQRQSFYTLNFADVLWKIQKWRENLPKVELFYAVKANSDPLLLKVLVLLGASFDCATEGEIRAVLKSGATPGKIHWAHTIKPLDGLMYARSVGVDMMSFDNEEELLKIHQIYPAAKLMLRICPSKVKCQFDLSNKFGCSEAVAMTLLEEAKKLSMDVIGICFHVGALCSDPDCFTATIRDCRRIFEHAGHIGHQLSVLDIGGGFYGASGTEKIFDKVTARIKDALDEHFPGVRIIAEPGCYVTGSAMNLVCTIIGKRTKQDNGAIFNQYYLNNGIYGSFFSGVEHYGIQAEPLLSESELQVRQKYDSVLFGQTCCSEDVIESSIVLPDMKVGECLRWTNMGAYSIPLCGTFCGVPLPFTVYVFREKKKLTPSEIVGYESAMDLLKKHAIFLEENADALEKRQELYN